MSLYPEPENAMMLRALAAALKEARDASAFPIKLQSYIPTAFGDCLVTETPTGIEIRMTEAVKAYLLEAYAPKNSGAETP